MNPIRLAIPIAIKGEKGTGGGRSPEGGGGQMCLDVWMAARKRKDEEGVPN